jgi:AmmeMemoRadiSam system protein B
MLFFTAANIFKGRCDCIYVFRELAVKGSFYPSERKTAEGLIREFISGAKVPEEAKGSRVVVAPHAGYAYSGKTAAYSYKALAEAACYIILSPNHTGQGEAISIFPEGKWRSLSGSIRVNDRIASEIASSLGVERDSIAHIGEHAIEVQLPFLQFRFGSGFSIVPITIAENAFPKLEELGRIIGRIMGKENVCVIASSDFSHFMPLPEIALIEKLDSAAFYRLVGRKQLSICGYAGIICAMEAARKTGCKSGQLLHYSTSAEVTHDETNVVGYAAISFR